MYLFNNNEIGYIFNQDCIETSELIDENSIDLIIADPPYYKIADKKDGNWDYQWGDAEEYIKWSKERILTFKRVLKKNGSFYLWGAIGYNHEYTLPKLADWVESEGLFKVINWITQKNTRGYGNKKGFMACREELIFMVPKECGTSYEFNNIYISQPTNRKDLGANGKPRKNENKRCTDVWTDITEASQSSKQRFYTSDGKKFPTAKALKLCDRILEASSKEGSKIYIPYAGSGSEIVSCIKNKRKFIASEIEKKYIEEIILDRLHNEFGPNIGIELDLKLNCHKVTSTS